MNYHSLPKIELHLHLDCSLSYKVVQQLNPAISYEEYQASFVAPPKCTDLADYITRAIKGNELMQTKEQLRLVTLDLFEQLQADHVIYAEIRFAPLLHIAEGLTPAEVVQAVNDAASEGKNQTGVEGRIICCTLRHYTEAQSMETVKLVQQFKGSNVVGFDIAADEAGFPVDNHISAFQFARNNDIHCTAHAGEAKGAESVWETLQQFHPSRIGHGVRSAEDEKLLDFLRQEKIHLEVCPTSNVQTNVFDTIEDHSADKIYNWGVSMSINTDSRTITPVTLAGEYALLEKKFSWKKEHFLKCNLEAIEHSFTSEVMKDQLRKKIIAAYAL
ncbi:MAG: adenosine deaminase [Bacteroidota bacterium]